MPIRKPPDFLIDAKPLELTEKEQAFAKDCGQWVEPAAVVDQDNPLPTGDEFVAKMDACLVTIRVKEAGTVLSWLNENGCLAFGALPRALAAIENGDHRR